MILTSVTADSHKLPGLGAIKYVYRKFCNKVDVVHDDVVIASFRGTEANLMRDQICMEVSREMAYSEGLVDRKAKKVFGRGIEVLRGRTRRREIVDERFMCMWWLRETTRLSRAKIGVLMGGFSSATVLHACREVENLKGVNRDFASKLDEFINA